MIFVRGSGLSFALLVYDICSGFRAVFCPTGPIPGSVV